MPIRITGMNSGLDTEAIIKELASAKAYKKTKMEKAQTKLGWKQEAWKALNTKIYDFYTKTLDDMRFSTAYSKKKVTCSNSNAVSIVANENAPYSTQSLDVLSVAKSGYMTGGQISSVSGGKISGSTTLADLGITTGTSFEIEVGKGTPNATTTTINITENTTLSELTEQLKGTGIGVNFDEKNQRFYLNSKNTGKENDFEIRAVSGDANSAAAIEALGFSQTASGAKAAHYEAAADASIRLNGVTYTSATNVFEVNGLTITANEVASGMTVTTQSDTSGIFDMVKNFFKGYNELINEMDKLYNADSAKGYEPLTDEEKDAMSDAEVEKWEKKVKDAVLRKDSTLSGVASVMKEVMSKGVTMSDGSQLYLFDFGIDTLGYFNAPDNERNAYHIDGDPDDGSTSGNPDKLKSMIASDPDTVISFFTQLSKNMYDKMSDLSKSVDGYRTFGNFYDDKKMKSDYDNYTSKIAEQEKKLAEYEDRWYAKFSAMETALAKMQQNASAVTSLLGG